MTTPLDPLRVPLRGSRLIEASAGTGKTWTIAALYLRLVLGHDADGRPVEALDPSRILVMTFTRAATRELSDRIRHRLMEAARRFRGVGEARPDPFIDALVAAFPDHALRERAAFRLATAADSMDAASIFTIDAWTGRMLREHAFDSGSLFDETLMPDENAMLAEAVRDYWRREIYPLPPHALDDALSAWPTVDDLQADVRRLLEHVPAATDERKLDAILACARDERDERLHAIKAGWPERAIAMQEWLIPQLNAGGSIGGPLRRHDAVRWLAALGQWAREEGSVETGITATGFARLAPASLIASAQRGHFVAPPDAFALLEALPARLASLPKASSAPRLHAAAHVGQRLSTLKRRAGVHGFHDLLVRLDRALRRPAGERLRERIVAQYPVALIDEFQDTSPLQYRIFERLYRPRDDDASTGLLLIGDPKQSIYAFRGADIQSYLRARVETTGRHDALTTNYRSRPQLVAAIDRLFGRAESWVDGAFRFGSSQHGTASPLPFVAVDAHGIGTELRDDRGALPAFTICHDEELANRTDAIERFAESAAEHIAASLVRADVGFADRSGGFRRIAPSDIAVLVRDRREARAMRRALRRRDVPSAFLSDQESIFASREAADLVHWLHAVAEPLDGRRARVGFATELIALPFDELAAMAGDDQVFERRIDQLRTLHDVWTTQGVLAMLRRTLHLLDLPALWLAKSGGDRRLTNVLHLAELLQAASATIVGPESLIRWLAEECRAGLDGDRRIDEHVMRLESDEALVRIVTIHKAKGLEYPVVYLPFACTPPRRFEGDVAFVPDPDGGRRVVFDVTDAVKSTVEREAAQEDVRLLYVAMTRARHALWIGVAALRVNKDPSCAFHRSAFGYLVGGGEAVDATAIGAAIERLFAGLDGVAFESPGHASGSTRVPRTEAGRHVVDVPPYHARFERDWMVGSFSSLVRELPTTIAPAAMNDPAVEEEVLSGPIDEPVVVGATATTVTAATVAARHRFPRGALAGNFLHEQLEWLAGERFAFDEDLDAALATRCDRVGWGYRADDAVTWLREVCATVLPPVGASLAGLPTILPEMEFWFPGRDVQAEAIDALCRRHLLDGRDRPALPARAVNGMLMGFADLVFEIDGRYWVLDYKSNALGPGDADYTDDAIARSMADHRYDVQGALYLLALHRLLRQRLGAAYDPARQLGGALYFYLRGIRGPVAGCHVLPPSLPLLDGLDALLADERTEAS